MRGLRFTLIMLAFASTTSAQKVDCLYHFESDIDTLSPADQEHVRTWAFSHYHFRHEMLEIRGHADKNADAAYNEALSMRRAKHIENILTKVGFDRIRTTYYGEQVPLCDKDEEACWSKNRRVEVILYNEHDQRWMADAHLEPPQVIFADTKQKVVLEGRGGTKINIGLGELLAPNGYPYFGPVRVELREILNPWDCIQGDISTVTKNELIETGGMAEVLVYRVYDNAPLSITNSIEIQFPSQREALESGMMTFEPIQTQDELIWSVPDWKVVPFDLKWYQVLRKGQRSRSEWYPTGTGAPGTVDEIVSDYVYKCDTVWLNDKQIQAKKARMSQGENLKNSIKMRSFGWINCDRFIREKGAVALYINTDCPEASTYVLFDNRKVAFDYSLYGQIRIPALEEITVVCKSPQNELGLTAFAIKKVTADGTTVDVKVDWLNQEELAQREKELTNMWS